MRQSDVCAVLTGGSAVYSLYAPLLDAYVVDYFVSEQWRALPARWRTALEEVEPGELATVVRGEAAAVRCGAGGGARVLPLSLLALLASARAYSLPRHPRAPHTPHSTTGCRGQSARVSAALRRGVKLKKQHEVERLSARVCEAARRAATDTVVDAGAGLGHLCRRLAHAHGLTAVGLEQHAALTRRARELDAAVERAAGGDTRGGGTRHVTAVVTADGAATAAGAEGRWGAVGLHACGDLAPRLLRLAADEPRVRFVCLVSCCYMKLSCAEEAGEAAGFPLSAWGRARRLHLSRTSREIACHAIEQYLDRLERGDCNHLQVHAYRAALEVILLDIDSEYKHTDINSVKHTDGLSFERYCDLALRGRMSEERVRAAVLAARGPESAARVAEWRRVVTVYTLRLALAPLLETLVLLDRALLLMERGLQVQLEPLFDPLVSPRSHLLVAVKPPELSSHASPTFSPLLV